MPDQISDSQTNQPKQVNAPKISSNLRLLIFIIIVLLFMLFIVSGIAGYLLITRDNDSKKESDETSKTTIIEGTTSTMTSATTSVTESSSSQTTVTTTSLSEQQQCELDGGIWGTWGLMGWVGCNPKTSDAGDTCNDNSECESDCIPPEGATTGNEVTGTCYEYKYKYGCYPTVMDGKVSAVICVD